MNSAQSVVVGAVAGACLGGVIVWASLAAETPAAPPGSPPAPTDSVRAAAVPPAPVATATDLSPITDRLDDLSERLRRLEIKLDRATASPERTSAIDNPKVMLDADTLQLAMEEVERKKIEALSDDALRNQAWQLMKADDRAGAVQRLQMLLERDLTPERRAEVTTELGMMQRSLGGPEGLEASARTLQSVIDSQGMQSRLGVEAAQQLVWTLAKNDPARALAVADAAVRSAGATPEQRINSRWAAAIVSQQLGDVVRARADYQSLLRDLAGQPNQQKLVADIERRLEHM